MSTLIDLFRFTELEGKLTTDQKIETTEENDYEHFKH